MRFEQVFSGVFNSYTFYFLATDNLFKLLILVIDFQNDSSQDSLKAMTEL